VRPSERRRLALVGPVLVEADIAEVGPELCPGSGRNYFAFRARRSSLHLGQQSPELPSRQSRAERLLAKGPWPASRGPQAPA
jgi:hypothetical protein